MMDNYLVSNNIKRLLNLRNLTQEQASDMLDVSLKTVNTLVNHPEKMQLGLLANLADLLKTSPSQLIEQDLTNLIQNNNIKNSSINGDVYNHSLEQLNGKFDQFKRKYDDRLDRLMKLVATIHDTLQDQ